MQNEKNLFDILNSVGSCSTIHEISEKIFLSEPYISKLLKQSEEKYEVKLVNRKTKPIQLTKAGAVVLKDLNQIINTRQLLKYDLSPYKDNNEYQIKIAFNQPWLETNSINVIKFLMKSYPEIEFSFYEQTTNLAQQNLLNHAIDIFIGKVLVNEQIDSNYLLNAQLYFLVPDNLMSEELGGPILTQNTFTKFDNLSYISLTDDSFFEAMIDNLFSEHEIQLNKIVKVANSQTAIKLAIEGMGFTVAMEDLAFELSKK